MKRGFSSITILLALLLCLAVYSAPCHAEQQTLSVGYGLGIFNNSSQIGHLWRNDYYDFAQVAYGIEKQLRGKFNLLAEPFVAYVNRPNAGVDVGLSLNGKYYLGETNHRGFFFVVGAGVAYTSVKFEEQGTHFLGILQGGIGYQWNNIYMENRFRHYSNGGTSSPNESVNAYTISMGWAF